MFCDSLSMAARWNPGFLQRSRDGVRGFRTQGVSRILVDTVGDEADLDGCRVRWGIGLGAGGDCDCPVVFADHDLLGLAG